MEKKRQLPYGNVLETPVSDETLSIQGAFADSKVVGDKFKEVKTETDSLKEDIIEEKKKVTWKNLFDKSKVTNGYLSDGYPATNDDFRISEFIKINYLTELTLSYTHIAYWYDEKKKNPKQVENMNSMKTDNTVSVPSDVTYIRFSTFAESIDKTQVGINVSRNNYIDYNKYGEDNLLIFKKTNYWKKRTYNS